MEVIGTIVVCLLIADLIVGTVHWAEDTYCGATYEANKAKAQGIVRRVCAANAWHHVQPTKMGDTFWSRNLLSIVVTWTLAAGCCIAGLHHWGLWLTAAVVCVGNEIHWWTHSKPPRLVKCLQEIGVCQSPQQHAKHHDGRFTTNYCTVTNWLNPILERLNYWRRLEAAIALTGITPKRTELVRDEQEH